MEGSDFECRLIHILPHRYSSRWAGLSETWVSRRLSETPDSIPTNVHLSSDIIGNLS